MFGLDSHCLIADREEDYYDLETYQGSLSRWCSGCGDNAILSAVQRLCRDEQLSPEKTVFVSGIGCAARFPHYMKTYGFHGLHGRALPVAQGVKIRRPDLHVFVNMGDGDCCSIGAAHWIHAIRYNMKMVAMLHDNGIYGLTKMQASPTTPEGYKTRTTPRGALLRPINPLTTTLGVTNVSFVANTVEWIPDLLYATIRAAYQHRGFAFVRILQRCPHFTKDLFEPFVRDPNKLLLLQHPDGIQLPAETARIFKNTTAHDPSDLDAAREMAEQLEPVPVGILYQDESVPTYDELRRPLRRHSPDVVRQLLESEFDKFGIAPPKAR
ncbi:MAG: hypothetical protein KC609_17685 [Myxococcales bacterium]|nr:hypothetical protein [Myxococcales bacterium]